MKIITAKNVNHALEDALWWLRVGGEYTSSRNGRVLMSKTPVITCYKNPMQRVMFSALRDANPFFHMMESLWMLAGRRDVAFPSRYAKQIAEYSDNGKSLYGAYGHRWRKWFSTDQLMDIVNMLKQDPSTRRAVLAMWDAYLDLPRVHIVKDMPCNTHIYFNAALGRLDMTVCCRSNDAVWGAYGANAVHMSMLHQFIAESAGIPMGMYYQFSNNFHVYIDRPDVQRLLNEKNGDVLYRADDRYATNHIMPVQLIRTAQGESMDNFMADLRKFMDDPDCDVVYATEFFGSTVVPMQVAHTAHKQGYTENAIEAAKHIVAEDWRIACTEWLGRRLERSELHGRPLCAAS